MSGEKSFWNHSLVWASVGFLGFAIYCEAGLRKQRASWPDENQTTVGKSAKKLAPVEYAQRRQLSAQTRRQLSAKKSLSNQKAEAMKKAEKEFLRRARSTEVQTEKKINLSIKERNETLKRQLEQARKNKNDNLADGEVKLTEEMLLKNYEQGLIAN